MIEAIYVVLTNAAPGRDADFNDWYSNVHARDTMRMRGGLAQQRFRLADEQVQAFSEPFPAQYLALYDVYDAAWFAQEHRDRARTPYMVIEDSLDMTRLDDFAYYPIAFRDNAPRESARCGVVLEQMQVGDGQEAAFREWYADVYLPRRVKQAGIVSGALLAFEEYGQMMPFDPGHDHVAIWRVESEAARAHWRGDDALASCPFLDRRENASELLGRGLGADHQGSGDLSRCRIAGEGRSGAGADQGTGFGSRERQPADQIIKKPLPLGEGLGWGLSSKSNVALAGQTPPPAPPLKGRGVGSPKARRHSPGSPPPRAGPKTRSPPATVR